MKESKLTLVPAPILKQKAKKVVDFGPDLALLAETMVATMRENYGIGLAAPQVGESKQVVVVEYKPDERGEKPIPLTVLVNPTITDIGKETDVMGEGCLSIPGVEIPVRRATQINVLAQDLTGKRVKIRAKDLLARILQHEIDHTNGILITKRAYPALEVLKGLRVIFLGTPEHAGSYLSALAATDMDIVGVFTETDKMAGRGKNATISPVKRMACELGLPVFQPSSLKDKSVQKQIEALKPDLAIVVAYGKIIPSNILAIPQHGFLNIHYSMLPELRGPSPHQTAILNRQTKTGVTIFKLDEGVDTGPIVAAKSVSIDKGETSQSLLAKMVNESIPLLLSVLPEYVSGKKTPKVQQSEQATLTKLIEKEDVRIDWSEPAEVIDAKIRAYHGWPTAFAEIGDERLLIHAAHLEDDLLVLDIVQPAGKKRMKFSDYAQGNRENQLTYLKRTGKIKLN